MSTLFDPFVPCGLVPPPPLQVFVALRAWQYLMLTLISVIFMDAFVVSLLMLNESVWFAALASPIPRSTAK